MWIMSRNLSLEQQSALNPSTISYPRLNQDMWRLPKGSTGAN